MHQTSELANILDGNSIGGVSIGMKKYDVLSQRGEPSDWEGIPQIQLRDSDLWCYGALQVCFDGPIVWRVNLFFPINERTSESDYDRDLLGDFGEQTWSTDRFCDFLSERGINFAPSQGIDKEFTLDTGLSVGFAYFHDIGEKRPDLPIVTRFFLCDRARTSRKHQPKDRHRN